MFSLLWSEHCAYKHSKKLLRTLPTEGERRRHGPGRERGRGRRRRRLGGRVQGRVAQPPERRRAVPGRGDRRRRDPARHLRDRRAADRRARLAALRRAATRERSRYLLDGAVARHRPLRQLDRRADDRRRGLLRGARTSRTAWSTRWRSGWRARRASSCAARRPASATSLVLFGASTGRDGIGGASVLASRRARRGRRGQAPDRPGRRPVRGEQALECSLELLERGLLVVAAGPRRRGADVARERDGVARAASGIDIDVARVPLREADMEPFEIMVSESQERMLCVVEPDQRRRGARADATSGRSTAPAIGEVTDTGRMRVFDGARARRRHAGRGARRRLPALRPRARGAGRRRSTRRRRRRSRGDDVDARRAARAARLARTSPRAGRCSSSTTRSCSRAPCAGPSEADAAVLALAGRRRDRGRDRRQRPPRRAPTPTRARSRPCSSARRTSPAPAPSRSGRPTA